MSADAVTQRETTPMSVSDVRARSPVPVVTTEQIARPSAKQVPPKAIVLIQPPKSNIGHFVYMQQIAPTTWRVFDPYGKRTEFSTLASALRRRAGGGKIVLQGENRYPYEKDHTPTGEAIETCGEWSLLRAHHAAKFGDKSSAATFRRMVKREARMRGEPVLDRLVVELTGTA